MRNFGAVGEDIARNFMENQLSIVNTEQEISLETNKEDIMSLFVKSIFGIVPFGSPIGEAITAVIPHQKFERMVDFVKVLNYKIKNAERKIEEHELKTQEFTDLIEDALGQASRALSKERLEYIASLLKNSLTDEELGHIEKKKLLSLLGELNDAEIIWLKNYSYSIRSFSSEEYKNFYENHKNVLEPIGVTFGSGQEQVDKDALQKSYKENLLKLGLIKESFKSFKKGELPEFDDKTGKLKATSFNGNTLGRLLLKYIDLKETEETE
jgi:hypothetical protein